MADSDGGDNMAAIARILEWLPAARTAGGCRLLGFFWHDLAWYLTRADRQDDALHAAAMAVARRWQTLVLPAILCGTLGYAVATFIGVAVGHWLR